MYAIRKRFGAKTRDVGTGMEEGGADGDRVKQILDHSRASNPKVSNCSPDFELEEVAAYQDGLRNHLKDLPLPECDEKDQLLVNFKTVCRQERCTE